LLRLFRGDVNEIARAKETARTFEKPVLGKFINYKKAAENYEKSLDTVMEAKMNALKKANTELEKVDRELDDIRSQKQVISNQYAAEGGKIIHKAINNSNGHSEPTPLNHQTHK